MINKKLDAAFGTASMLLFAAPLSPFSKYAQWLSSGLPPGRAVKAGDTDCFVPNYGVFRFISDGRVAAPREFEDIGGIKLKIAGADALQLAKRFHDTVKFVVNYSAGSNLAVSSSTMFKNCSNAHACVGTFDSKFIAYCSWSDFNEYCFGVYRTFYSQHCIKCYFSSRLRSCFEVDSCNNCSGLYFCHNCENVHDSAFCFNASNMRYAIGNQIVGREKFLLFKSQLQKVIIEKLEKDSTLGISIFG
ncbi:hypothetical protein J4441_02805 [Candidatus Micrarchaeota archaeon]|nr:hypothetical protein [Candidatus Micrarchaeota archaeon]